MENERLAILKMLENGKITAGEAAKLLETVSSGGQEEPQRTTPRAAAPRRISTSTNTQQNYNTAPYSSTPSSTRFEEFAGEMSKKFGSFAKDMEPKLQKLGETVVENTAGMADRIGKAISAPPRPTARPSARVTTGALNIERNVELKLSGKDNELNISGFNGEVVLKGYNGDKITAKISARLNRAGAYIELVQLGNKFFLQYDENDFKSVAINAYIPEYLFRSINAETVNGQLFLSMLQTETLNIKNMNGNSDLQNLDCGNISYEGSNGKLKIMNAEAKNAKIENFNGDIYVTGLDVESLQAESFNGVVNMSIPKFECFADYTWIVDVSNAALTMNIPGGMGIGYYVKAHSTLKDIKCALTGMNYLSNSSNFVEARSYDFESARTKVKLSLETSNGTLTVN